MGPGCNAQNLKPGGPIPISVIFFPRTDGNPWDTVNSSLYTLNSLPNDKMLDWSKFKGFAENKINAAEMIISLSNRVENIVGKGDNADYQHFLLFPPFQKASYTRYLKVGTVW